MSENTQLTTVNPIKEYFTRDTVKKKFEELLGDNSQGFITSVLQIVNNNNLLQKATPSSIYNAAAMAATMKLPINQNLGFAWIVPYKGQAQFQMGWKGYVQLAQRTEQFKTIKVAIVYENQIEDVDNIWSEVSFKNVPGNGKVAGFAAYFSLLNGFEKMLYMSKQQMDYHAKKYSQSYKSNKGVWADGEDGYSAMGQKTILKLLLNRFAPLSIETASTAALAKAIRVDQGVVLDTDGEEITYIDNESPDINKEIEQVELLIDDCKTWEDLQSLTTGIDKDILPAVEDKINAKRNSLTA
jgi:recombination protein RecT